jgi:poly(3-hydroxybutyrate) depolymerase
MLAALTLSLVLGAAQPAPAVDKVVKETFGVGGLTRTYYLFVPSKATDDNPAPLLLLLHGSGRDGRSLLDPWLPLAKERGIILVAPESNVRKHWSMREDGPDFFYALIEMVRVQRPVDPRRLYVFGHSAGALHGLAMAVLESEYFAAVAAHAGVLPPEVVPFVPRAPRKTPISIWVGSEDPLFPVPAVRETHETLNSHGYPAELTVIAAHTHAYYARAGEINEKAWGFLQRHRLDEDPKFQRYETR